MNGRQGFYDEDEGQQVHPGNWLGSSTVEVEREHMFDKVVTPSDVGKLNRLVIPKQHAERYFPLDSSTKDKGLLLSFEDKNGKPWRFRYSYWNSSQSYVMTKGWSRFVKEHKLDAGDIVSFHRGVAQHNHNRLFIHWRRPPPHPQLLSTTFPHPHLNFSISPWNPIFLQHTSIERGGGGGGGGYGSAHLHLPQSTSYGGPPPPNNNNYGYTTTSTPCSGSVIYFRSASAPQQHLGMQVQIQQNEILSTSNGIDQVQQPPPPTPVVVPVVQGKSAAAKRLRLFGVNMDCPIYSSDSQEIPLPSTYTCSSSSSSSTIPYLQLTPPTPSSSDKAKPSISMDLDI